MLTPQEVSTRAFNKAVMGGYNMSMVDEFLDELTDDYTALYKENAALKAKMKLLVEKVEEYRTTEDSMRATLLTAQKMADSIVHGAEEKRDEMLAKAEKDAAARVEELKKELADTEHRLREGKLSLNRFIAASKAACSRQLELMEKLPELPVDEPIEKKEDRTAKEIEANVLFACREENAADKAEPAAETAESAESAEKKDDSYPEGNPFTRESAFSDKPVGARESGRTDEGSRLGELKFGRNYTGTRLKKDDKEEEKH